MRWRTCDCRAAPLPLHLPPCCCPRVFGPFSPRPVSRRADASRTGSNTHTHTWRHAHPLSQYVPSLYLNVSVFVSFSSSPSLKLCISRTIASALALAVSHARSLSFPPCISLTYSLLFLSHPSPSSALPRSISLFFSPPGSLALSFVPLYITLSRFFLCSKIGSDVVHVLLKAVL